MTSRFYNLFSGTSLWLAAGLVVVACLFFAGANAIGKLAMAADPAMAIHPSQVVFFRFLFGFLTLSPILILRGRAVVKTEIPLKHALRVSFGIGGFTCMMMAFQSMPLADATVISWSSPVFAVMFAGLLLKEPIGRASWFAVLIGFAGVVVTIRPGEGVIQAAALWALAAAVVASLEVITIRYLAQRDSALTILLINNGLGAVLSFLIAIPVLQWPSADNLPLLASVGAVMVTGQAIFLRAAARAEASFIAPFYYATLPWSVVLGFILFDENPDWYFYLGSALIVGGGLFATLNRNNRTSSK